MTSYEYYDDTTSLAETDTQHRYARIERDGTAQYVVLLGRDLAGSIGDEADADGRHLPRGRYAAWSGKTGPLGFFAALDEAADAIAETWPAPAGPRGAAEPKARVDTLHVRIMDPMRRYNAIAEAARLYAEGGRTPSRAWKEAIDADWKRRIAATPVHDEDEYENCISVLGGAVHTATPHDDPKMRTMPLCRTGDQNQMRTRYTITKLDITCTNCVAQRERRATRRAAQQG